MGGRIATQVAAGDPSLPLTGLVLLGYPLHPPGKLTERRDKHLPAIGRPMLFVQGARDAFGTPSQLTPIVSALQPASTIRVVDDGDHSFKPRRASGVTFEENLRVAASSVAAFVRQLAPAEPQKTGRRS